MQAVQTAIDVSFKNILLLTDFSEASEAAMAYATGFARHYDAQLYPANVCNPVILTESVAAAETLQELEDISRTRLTTMSKKIGPKSTPLFTLGSVADAVPHWVDKYGIDLIVMGTHGHKGLQHIFLGSIAEEIIRSATCPVLTVGPHVKNRPDRNFNFKKVLCPTDLKEHAEFTAHFALSLSQQNSSALTFMHVIPVGESFGCDQHDLKNTAHEELVKLTRRETVDCKSDFIAEVGDPAHDILSYAKAGSYDLIVLGLPADKKFKGPFRTGVTYNVISSAPCPVLTLRDTSGDS